MNAAVTDTVDWLMVHGATNLLLKMGNEVDLEGGRTRSSPRCAATS